MFDATNPPKTYKKFRKQVLDSIAAYEVKSKNQMYPPAIFYVSKDKQKAGVEFIAQLIAEVQDSEDLYEMLHEKIPEKILSKNAGFTAIVLPGNKFSHEEEGAVETVIVVMTGLDNTSFILDPPDVENYIVDPIPQLNKNDVFMAEVDRSDEYASLEFWEKEDEFEYSEMLTSVREAIVPQDYHLIGFDPTNN